jgi:hypothetical protein
MNQQGQSLPCSRYAFEMGTDPVGTAGTYQEYFLLEIPLPWAPDVWDSRGAPKGLKEHFSALESSGREFRAMGIVPEDEAHKEGSRILIHYSLPSTGAPRFERQVFQIPEAEIHQALIGLTEGMNSELQAWQIDLPAEREMLVCTHGKRDQCCGTQGYPIYAALKEMAPDPENLRVWRVSHTGGHRFAPTCIDFPTGHYWAWLTEELVEQIVHREALPHDLQGHYRGWSALPPKSQVAERLIFLHRGWSAWDERRTFQTSAEATGMEIHIGGSVFAVQITEECEISIRPRCSSETMKSYKQYKTHNFRPLSSHE